MTSCFMFHPSDYWLESGPVPTVSLFVHARARVAHQVVWGTWIASYLSFHLQVSIAVVYVYDFRTLVELQTSEPSHTRQSCYFEHRALDSSMRPVDPKFICFRSAQVFNHYCSQGDEVRKGHRALCSSSSLLFRRLSMLPKTALFLLFISTSASFSDFLFAKFTRRAELEINLFFIASEFPKETILVWVTDVDKDHKDDRSERAATEANIRKTNEKAASYMIEKGYTFSIPWRPHGHI